MISAASSCTAARPARVRPTRLAAIAGLWRSRRVLAELDTARLDDIGLTAQEAAAEAKRPVWDVPKGWRR